MPQSIVDALKAGHSIAPELYDSASICFVDIVGFTNFCSQSSPIQIVATLNELFTMFDALITAADVYKVETIGDAYMCVSGVPKVNGIDHVKQIALIALAFIEVGSEVHHVHFWFTSTISGSCQCTDESH